MIGRFLFAGLAALALSACGDTPEDSEASAPPPLLWEVASADGEVEGWLYGTIHALPGGVRWRSTPIETAIADADLLVVEVAALEDGAAISRQFATAARTPGLPALAERVRPSLRDEVAELVEKTPYSARDFRSIESWAAALILAQVSRGDADSANGVDKALIRDFSGREIVELEGAAKQFAIFDGLAEQDQRAMLSSVLEEVENQSAGQITPVDLWLAGDEEQLAAETRRGILADPDIYSALLVDRNTDWIDRIIPMFESIPRPLVAVGAAHLVGQDGLVTLLEAQGYTLTRLR
ncbi:TraB/GumN family protein [Parerythrobacter jejuensis]|uniref:TraB/GumN family protein n=1 Tax=Parerythrobacter jejuensis TaxID=795812 RepID=A0A845APS5_9SPHN|nr:TraB/GumN family protein [Parerythrobacter jejuensis]MXP32310.1 TraB/GumN family protein [Parerythrobacter jejuensis]